MRVDVLCRFFYCEFVFECVCVCVREASDLAEFPGETLLPGPRSPHIRHLTRHVHCAHLHLMGDMSVSVWVCVFVGSDVLKTVDVRAHMPKTTGRTFFSSRDVAGVPGVTPSPGEMVGAAQTRAATVGAADTRPPKFDT